MNPPLPLPHLRSALAAHLGQVLTPEAATEIYLAASQPQDNAIDPQRFAPLRCAGHVIAVERFRAILAELHRLHEEHYPETEKHRQGIPLNPDYGEMLRLERAGRMVQFTVRVDDDSRRMVGNLRMYLGTSLHTQSAFADGSRLDLAEEDTLFISKPHRGGVLAMRLLAYAEDVLVNQLGVREIRADSKLVNRADVLMRRRGYQAVATKFVKVFPGADDVQ